MGEWRFEAIGTGWEIETGAPLTDDVRAAVTAGSLSAPDAGPMLDAYRELDAATAGAVNPLVADSLEALGYDAAYSLRAGEPRPAPASWTSLLTWSADTVEAHGPALLDVGALGKGRLVDRVMAVLADVPGDVVVDAGGDIRVRGAGVRVALEHPFDARKAIGVVEITDGTLCASAINRRAWGEGLHHVLDARTGQPVRTWAATWALAPEAMTADAVATALFFDGGPELAARWGVEWVRMTTDGRVQRSPGCQAELFTAAPARAAGTVGDRTP